MAEPDNTPKYSPRSAAAEFTAGLPKLGVEEAPIVPATPQLPNPVIPPEVKPVVTPVEPKVAPAAPAAPAEVKIPRTSKDWDAYKVAEKSRLAEKETEIEKWKKEVEELRKAPPVSTVSDDDPRIVSTQRERDELSEKLRMVDITSHPKFKAYYDNKTNAQIDMAKRIVGTENSEAIATLLKLPDNEYRQGKIEELVSQLSPIQQSRVAGVLNSLNEIDIERDGQIEQAKKDYVVYQEKAKTDAEAKQKENMTKAETAFTSVLSTLQNPKDKDGLFIFQKQDGNEEWNKGVDERTKYAKEMLFGKHDPQVLIRAAFHAAALPGVVKAYQTLQEQLKGLESQVKGMTAAQPKLESRTTPEGGEKAPAGTRQEGKKGRFLGGRQLAKDWIGSLNQPAGEE
jgi:hypothetical protein